MNASQVACDVRCEATLRGRSMLMMVGLKGMWLQAAPVRFASSLGLLTRFCENACRYAGRAFEKEADIEGSGTLMVKGLKSMWRQAAPVVRRTLHGCLLRILMQVRPCACTCHRSPAVLRYMRYKCASSFGGCTTVPIMRANA